MQPLVLLQENLILTYAENKKTVEVLLEQN